MKTSSIQLALFAASFALLCVANAQIEKWVDQDGKIHYGSYSPGDVQSKSLENAPITFSNGSSQVELPVEVQQGGDERPLGLSKPNFEKQDANAPQIAVLFTTSWCGYCKKARAYMARNGIAYMDFDIEKDGNARAEYRRYKGKGVPLLVMGNKTLRGFNSKRYNRFFK